MKIAVKISTLNDNNGNPRRGWIIYEVFLSTVTRLEFMDEGYEGFMRVTNKHGNVQVIADIPVSPSYYRKTKSGNL